MNLNYLYCNIFFVCILLLPSCKNVEKEGFKIKTKKVKNENFESFYFKFNQDSIFQISRVKFPIKVYIIDGNYNPNEANENTNWEIIDWRFLNFKNSDFKIKILKTDSIIKHSLYQENSGFEVYREFKLEKGKWFLTYYSFQNL